MSNLVRVDEERQWGMLSYILPLVITMVTSLGWVASIGIWAYYRSKSRFVSVHASQSLALFVLTLVTGTLAGISFVTIFLIPLGIVFLIAAVVTGLVLPIYAGIQASRGRDYIAPLIGRAFRSAMR